MGKAHSPKFHVQPVQDTGKKASSTSQHDIACENSAQLGIAGSERVRDESHDDFRLADVLWVVEEHVLPDLVSLGAEYGGVASGEFVGFGGHASDNSI